MNGGDCLGCCFFRNNCRTRDIPPERIAVSSIERRAKESKWYVSKAAWAKNSAKKQRRLGLHPHCRLGYERIGRLHQSSLATTPADIDRRHGSEGNSGACCSSGQYLALL